MSTEQRLRIAPGQARRLQDRDGELTVIDGRAWLTLDRVDEDHFLNPGARIRLRAGHGAVVGPAGARHAVVVKWRPKPSLAARSLAASLRMLARGFTSLARHATARADLLH